jgi:vacuolar-type H+-ATPase subunit I/STV1
MKVIEHAPEALAQAKHWYEDTGMPVEDIAKFLDIGVTTFYTRLRTIWKWKKRNRRLADLDAAAIANVPLERVREIAEPAKKTLEKLSLIDRVRSAVETEIAKIEDVLRRVEGVHLRSSDAERAARTLATLVRTLKELTALEKPDGKRERKQDGPSDEASDEASDEFSDLEDFRRSLAERLDRLRAGGET